MPIEHCYIFQQFVALAPCALKTWCRLMHRYPLSGWTPAPPESFSWALTFPCSVDSLLRLPLPKPFSALTLSEIVFFL